MDRIFTSCASITLRQVGNLKEHMIAEFEKSDHICLDLPEGSSVDFCGLQLIESARLYATMNGKRLSLLQPAEHLRSVLDDAGFIAGMPPDADRFWFHEEPTQ